MISRFRLLMFFFMVLGGYSGLQLSCAPPPKKNKGCTSHRDCKNLTEECNLKTGDCQTIVCQSNNDCRGGWYCNPLDNRCQSTPAEECTNDQDCQGKQQRCSKGKCVSVECFTDKDCTDASKTLCKNYVCVSPPPECSSDQDCQDPNKPKCKEGQCVSEKPPPECTLDQDCTNPTTPRCEKGKCVPAGAGEGEPCEEGKNPCQATLLCYSTDPQSKKGTCQPSCNPYQPSCKTPLVCLMLDKVQGVCVTANGGKKAGESCENDPCEKNLFCVLWKGKKICALPCDSSNPNCGVGEECFEVEPEKNLCVSEREPCGPGRPCKTGVCGSDGKCNPPPTCATVTCPSDEVCEKGVCRKKKCPTEMKCPPGQTCNSATGTCQSTPTSDPPCVPCAADGSCPNPTDRCLGGLSNNPSERFCIASCAAGGVCSNSKHFHCVQVNLTVGNQTCTTDSDCKNSKLTCSGGKCIEANVSLCIPVIGTCRNQCKTVTCPAGKFCVPSTGECLGTGKKLCDPCKHKDECGGVDDLCLSGFSDGNKYCGQDCRSQPCPTGYQCFSLQGGSGKQCAPANLKCGP